MKSQNDISNQLITWYNNNKQSMPWRDDKNIYHIWLSEIMLQQTQINTVIPYYTQWLKQFPTINDVASASEDDILKLWEGLGYYSRALNFHNACKTIIESYDGEIPKKDFIKLKGVGPYIDAAVRSIGYHDVTPTIDGNVNRVVSRLLCLKKPPQKEHKKIYNFLIQIINPKVPGDFNQAMMDLGRNICKPKKPSCLQCPLSTICKAYKKDSVNQYPMKIKTKKIPNINVAVGIIWKKNNILIAKRKSQGLLPGLWEFPGGKVNHHETSADCVIREIYEETGVTVELKSFITNIKHQYSHFSISLDSFHCIYKSGTPEPRQCTDIKWIKPTDIPKFAFPKANHKFMDHIPINNPWL